MKLCNPTLFLALVTLVLLGFAQAFVPRAQTPGSSRGRLVVRQEGFNFMEMGSRFLNELLPWGDTSKGMWAGKRDAMVEKYMGKTGITREQAEEEVDEYLKDKEGYIARARAKEALEAQKKK